MRKMLQSYGKLSRVERAGYAALSALLFLLILVRLFLHHFVHPPKEDERAGKMLAAEWAAFQEAHTDDTENAYAATKKDWLPDLNAQPFLFDPNTLDSGGFRRLGLSAKATKGLLRWRSGGMVFRKPEDFERLYNLPPQQFLRLAPYIRIDPAAAAPNRFARKPWASKFEPLPATLDLNTTDSATLVRLPAIGSTLAHKIIAQRNGLGGFLKHEQLLEVYKFPDSTMTMLRERLVIRPEAVIKLGLNGAGLEQLSAHPYIGEKMAKNIILYREGMHGLSSVGQLRQAPLMNADLFRRIAPYFEVDPFIR